VPIHSPTPHVSNALLQAGVLFVMTHDSIGLGEDGPTHQVRGSCRLLLLHCCGVAGPCCAPRPVLPLHLLTRLLCPYPPSLRSLWST